jgi:hypothetical protein
VNHCGSVLSDVRDYFRREFDRIVENRRAKQRQSLIREEVVEENVVHNIDSENDEKLQRAIHALQKTDKYSSTKNRETYVITEEHILRNISPLGRRDRQT